MSDPVVLVENPRPSVAEDAERIFAALEKCEELYGPRPGGGHWEEDVTEVMRVCWDHGRFLAAIEHLYAEGRADSRLPDDADEPINFFAVIK